MVQNPAKISRQQIGDVLGHNFSESEFSNCLQQIKIIKPKVGKFWQTEGAEAGVYLVIQGKVRLIDSSDELVSNLISGESFGEATFFPDADLKAYSARASRNLELCYLPPELLLTLVSKHPKIQDHLYQQALKHNSLFANSEKAVILNKPEVKAAKALAITGQKTAKKLIRLIFLIPAWK